MSDKKKSIQVKLQLTGELKELIEAESEREFRSCTQQIYYILNRYYKELNGVKKELSGEEKEFILHNNELLGTNTHQKELLRTNSENNELLGTNTHQNEFLVSNNDTNSDYNYTNSEYIEPIEQYNISDDILDF